VKTRARPVRRYTPSSSTTVGSIAVALIHEPAGARFLYRLAKSARKRWCGLTTVTQDPGHLLGHDLAGFRPEPDDPGGETTSGAG